MSSSKNSFLFDMHAHLMFYPDSLAAANKLASAGAAVLCATVAPSEYEKALETDLGSVRGVRLGVGLHPWWIADGRCGIPEVEQVAQLVKHERYVAEVGLDFAGNRIQSRQAQVEALNAVLTACENGGHLLSIHAVQSANTVLDMLAFHRTYANNDVIFHWFSGSGEDLVRAVREGCFFSVNARMLSTRRGRSYVQQIPLVQLLLETDAPSSVQEGTTFTVAQHIEQLEQTAAAVEKLHGDQALEIIAETSTRLLEI